MPKITIIFAAILIALGGYGALHHYQQVGTLAPTALIPAYFGLVLGLLGVLSLAAPNMRKHFMHFAAMVALLGALAPVVPLIIRASKMSSLAIGINVAMILTCAVLLALYVRSFIAVRKAREATRGFEVTNAG